MRRSTALSAAAILAPFALGHPTLDGLANSFVTPTLTPSAYSLAPQSSANRDVLKADPWPLDTAVTQRQADERYPFENPDNLVFGYPEHKLPTNEDQTGAHSGLGTGSILLIIAGATVTTIGGGFALDRYDKKHHRVIRKPMRNAFSRAKSLCSWATLGRANGSEQPTEQSLELGQYAAGNTQWSQNPSGRNQPHVPPPSYYQACMPNEHRH